MPQLSRTINHSEALKLPMRCNVTLRPKCIVFNTIPIYPHISDDSQHPFGIDFTILCEGIDWQVSHLTQTLSHTSAVPSNMVHSTIQLDFNPTKPIPEDRDDTE